MSTQKIKNYDEKTVTEREAIKRERKAYEFGYSHRELKMPYQLEKFYPLPKKEVFRFVKYTVHDEFDTYHRTIRYDKSREMFVHSMGDKNGIVWSYSLKGLMKEFLWSLSMSDLLRVLTELDGIVKNPTEMVDDETGT